MDTTLNLNMGLVHSCNNASQFNAGDSIVKDAQVQFERFQEQFGDFTGLTNEQLQYVNRRYSEYKNLIETAYNEQLSRRASYVPVNVAGPSKYPAAKMEKRADKMMERSIEWQEKIKRFMENTAKGIKDLMPIEKVLELYRSGKCSDPIQSDDEYAEKKLIAKIEYHMSKQEHMKKLNAYYRKHKTCKGFESLSDETAAKIDKSIDEDRSWVQAPYPQYKLTNNNSELKRLKNRLITIQNQKELGTSPDILFTGGRIVDNDTIGRVQILFDSIPDEETRKKLKGRGFNWSPKEKAWQRLRTPQALQAAKGILGL